MRRALLLLIPTCLLLLVAARPPTPAALRNIATPAGPNSGEPNLTVAPDGRVWLTWFERRDSTTHRLRTSVLGGSRWSRPVTIAEGDSFVVNWADFPVLAVHAGNRLVAAWPWRLPGDGDGYEVRLSQSLDGGKNWSRPTRPHRDGTATEHGFVSLLREGAGTRVVWLDGRDYANHPMAEGEHGLDGETALRTTLLDSQGRPGHDLALDARVCDCCQTAAVRTSRGVLVAYRDRSADEIRDISVVRIEGGGWKQPVSVHRDGWKMKGCPVNGPALDAAGDHVAIAWYTAAGDTHRVYVAFSEDGGRSFGSPIRVDAGDPFGRVDMALLEDGAAMVSWLENRGGHGWIVACRVEGSGAAGKEWPVASTSSARPSGFPRMVRAGDRLVFAWTETGKVARVRTAVAKLSTATADNRR